MKFSTAALSCLFFAPTAFGVAFSGTITITNEAPTDGTCQTPVWVGVHDGTFDTYDSGVEADAALEAIAEDGNTGPLVAAFAAAPGGVWDGVLGSGAPICSGETLSIPFAVTDDVTGPLYFSYASMVLPSNDAFIANGNPLAHMVLSSGGATNNLAFTVAGSEVLDAGTEVNDEEPDNTAFFGQSSPNTGTDENSVVTAHPGFNDASTGGILADPDFANADFTASGFNMISIAVTIAEDGDDNDAPDNDGGGGSCFSKNGMVDVEGSMVSMKDLKVGDRVLTGKNRYQPVYAFGHHHEEREVEFLKIAHKAGTSSIELSAEHLIYVKGKVAPVRADSIQKGDTLVVSQANHQPAEVTKISTIVRKGLYAPLTEDGTIVVDGVVASTYATLLANSETERININGWTFPFVDQAAYFHIAVSPLRMMCRMTASSLGVCQGSYDEEGYNGYVSWAVSMIRWGEQLNTATQFFLGGLFLAGFAIHNVFETALLGGGEPLMHGLIFGVVSLVLLAAANTSGSISSFGQVQKKTV